MSLTIPRAGIDFGRSARMENKGPFINELPQSGEVTLLAVVLEKDLRPKRNGGFFLALRFADRSGELDGKCGRARKSCRNRSSATTL